MEKKINLEIDKFLPYKIKLNKFERHSVSDINKYKFMGYFFT